MNRLDLDEVCRYVNEHVVDFHNRGIKSIEELKLDKLLTKNPYLFKAKNVTTASELISSLLDAFLSSSEEKLFGDFLEGLAIYIAEMTCGGHKSTAPGVDLEFIKKNSLCDLCKIRNKLGQQLSTKQIGTGSEKCRNPSQAIQARRQCSTYFRYLLWKDKNQLCSRVHESSRTEFLVSY